MKLTTKKETVQVVTSTAKSREAYRNKVNLRKHPNKRLSSTTMEEAFKDAANS